MSAKQKNERPASGGWQKRDERSGRFMEGVSTRSPPRFAHGEAKGGDPFPSGTESSKLADRARRAAEAMTDDEDAAITSAAKADPDAQPVDELFTRRGRPRLANPKQPVLLRIDPEVISRFKAGGEGWQTRMNEALRKAVGLD